MFLAEKGHVLEEKNETTDFWLLKSVFQFFTELEFVFYDCKESACGSEFV